MKGMPTNNDKEPQQGIVPGEVNKNVYLIDFLPGPHELAPKTMLYIFERIEKDNYIAVVTVLGTPVVYLSVGEAILMTWGWRTRMTLKSMNVTSAKLGLGFEVFSKNDDWFVRYRGTTSPFDSERIRLNLINGQVSPVLSSDAIL